MRLKVFLIISNLILLGPNSVACPLIFAGGLLEEVGKLSVMPCMFCIGER
jgi:hypothetical protein